MEDRHPLPAASASFLLLAEALRTTVEDAPIRTWQDLQMQLDEHASRHGADPVLCNMQATVLMKMERRDPAGAKAVMDRLSKSDHAALRELAQSLGFRARAQQIPVRLKFDALDGREVDFEKLRGKVVLLDFWATWCAPCVAELPHIKRLHDVHAKDGLQVVGVSLDRRQDAAKLTTFVREHALSWPQHFVLTEDGANELAVRLGVTAIPTVFLFDKSGRLVVVDVPPDQLDSEVERLLRE